MLLVIDIGNTNTVFGVYEGKKLVGHWRTSTNSSQTADEIGLMILHFLQNRGISPTAIKALVIASVVPPILNAFEQMAHTYFHLTPLVVGPGTKTGIPIRYDNPKEVGADRVCNALAAVHNYGCPAIVVDFGTSTNFDAVSPQGEYLGGAIAPGILISMEALFQRASKLPRIDLVRPSTAIGKTTVNSIRSGIFFGTLGQIKEIITQIARELGGNPVIIATGGLCEMIAPEIELIQHVDKHLTLKGLRLIYEINCL